MAGAVCGNQRHCQHPEAGVLQQSLLSRTGFSRNWTCLWRDVCGWLHLVRRPLWMSVWRGRGRSLARTKHSFKAETRCPSNTRPHSISGERFTIYDGVQPSRPTISRSHARSHIFRCRSAHIRFRCESTESYHRKPIVFRLFSRIHHENCRKMVRSCFKALETCLFFKNIH